MSALCTTLERGQRVTVTRRRIDGKAVHSWTGTLRSVSPLGVSLDLDNGGRTALFVGEDRTFTTTIEAAT